MSEGSLGLGDKVAMGETHFAHSDLSVEQKSRAKIGDLTDSVGLV
jgi:hypothetical protein